MGRIPAWRRYARFFGVDVRRDVDDELRFHIDAKTQALVDGGLSPDAARAEALRQFGAVSDVRALCESLGTAGVRRGERRLYLTGWGQDLRYALRTLRRTPLVSCIAIVSIALGVGANTAIFTLLDQVLLRTAAGRRRPSASSACPAKASTTAAPTEPGASCPIRCSRRCATTSRCSTGCWPTSRFGAAVRVDQGPAERRDDAGGPGVGRLLRHAAACGPAAAGC